MHDSLNFYVAQTWYASSRVLEHHLLLSLFNVL